MQIKDLGFTDWVSLYNFIKAENLHNEQRIALVFPVADEPTIMESVAPVVLPKPREVVLDLEFIQSNAFAELYSRLPTMAAVETVAALVQGVDKIIGKKNSQPVLEFLNKIPTRSE